MNVTSAPAGAAAQSIGQPRSRLLLAFPALSVAGIGISGYLTYIRVTSATPMCVVGGGCETVNSSAYAAIGDLPIAILGMGLYGLIFVLGLLAVRGPAGLQAWATLGIFGLSFSGTLYSGYLTYIAVIVLRATCMWCLTSAAIVTIMFGLATWSLLRPSGALGDE